MGIISSPHPYVVMREPAVPISDRLTNPFRICLYCQIGKTDNAQPMTVKKSLSSTPDTAWHQGFRSSRLATSLAVMKSYDITLLHLPYGAIDGQPYLLTDITTARSTAPYLCDASDFSAAYSTCPNPVAYLGSYAPATHPDYSLISGIPNGVTIAYDSSSAYGGPYAETWAGLSNPNWINGAALSVICTATNYATILAQSHWDSTFASAREILYRGGQVIILIDDFPSDWVTLPWSTPNRITWLTTRCIGIIAQGFTPGLPVDPDTSPTVISNINTWFNR